MNAPRDTLSGILLLVTPALAFASPTPQTLLGETSLGLPSAGAAVGVVPHPNGQYVYCSLYQDGRQQVIDVSNPATPLLVGPLIDPDFGDQFNDPLFFKDSLYTANRYGGINRLAIGAGGATLRQADAVSTIYHFKGLAAWSDGTRRAARSKLCAVLVRRQDAMQSTTGQSGPFEHGGCDRRRPGRRRVAAVLRSGRKERRALASDMGVA